MKKYEYKLESYHFKIMDNLVLDMEKAFNKEGSNGWELVQWNLMPPTALLTATTTPCCGSICILATFKKKLRV
nr:MAG TPA: protein of unknown function (DUF4177) [Caudoviricetes sp.]